MVFSIPELESKLFSSRDSERFYDYPPVLSEISEEAIWHKRPIQLYVHIPFCLKKCHYCPYFKEIYNKKQAQNYMHALKREIRRYADKAYIAGRCIDVVYIGGGTPGCLSSDLLAQLLDAIHAAYHISDNAQITMELNPTVATMAKLSRIKSWGVNRVSFGVQSFDDEMLKLLGRTHDGKRAVEAVDAAQKAGFRHINIDLLFKIPGQTLPRFQEDLLKAVSLPLNHISLFGLNIKPKTRLYEILKNLPDRPSIKLEAMLLKTAEEILGANGFLRYSIDAFCRNGARNQYTPYNSDVLGLGAGAFSHIHHAEYNNCPSVAEYILKTGNGLPIHLGKKLTSREEIERYLVYAVLNLEIDKKEFFDKFGVAVEDVAGGKIHRLVSDQLIIETKDAFRITEKGFFFIFNISKYFFSDRYQLLTELL